MSQPHLIVVGICLFSVVYGSKHGLLLLYRPLDVSNECAFSGHLRYDLSFGMGMSDTITMVFRTLNEIDYACNIEIVTQHEQNVFLVVVIKFPTSISKNCHANGDAFNVIKKNRCLRLCDLIGSRDMLSSYFVITVKGRIRFRFLSNSSINSDIDADLYQVTATAARMQPPSKCNLRNETLCVIDRQDFCFTNGVVCDGIKNCGVTDWFDERKSECSLPIEYLSYAPVIAVVGALVCSLLAGGHILMRCLPPLANSFFIFNANEDNRLCIDPIYKSPVHVSFEMNRTKRKSLIPVSLRLYRDQNMIRDYTRYPVHLLANSWKSSNTMTFILNNLNKMCHRQAYLQTPPAHQPTPICQISLIDFQLYYNGIRFIFNWGNLTDWGHTRCEAEVYHEINDCEAPAKDSFCDWTRKDLTRVADCWRC